MNRLTFASLAVLTIVGIGITMGLTGCSDSASTDSATTPASTEAVGADSSDAHDHGDHDHEGHDHGAMEKGLAELSEADRKAAVEQHLCPVTGEMLGTMGTPIKVSLEDQDVWVCCKGCVKKMTEDPGKYLAKLAEHGDHKGGEHKNGEEHGDHKHDK